MSKVQILNIVMILVPWLWAGLILGVSFIATPVKFQAQTLELGPAFDVGRHTFLLFNKIEWVMFAALVLVVLLGKSPAFFYALTAALLAILVVQTFWLLPELASRAEAVIAGTPKPKSSHHMSYVMLEILKLIIVASMGIKSAMWMKEILLMES